MTDLTYVIAGNGASLTQSPKGSILASDHMVRVNNFFFEPQSYLGPRVDLAVMGGDPRVAPFMFETLRQCRHTYDIKAWTSHNPAVIRAGMRHFGACYQPLRYGDPALQAQVQALIAQYGCTPMTGTYAVLAAHGAGAERIILTGMDFYQTRKRYAYQAGKHQKALLGADLDVRGLDQRLHNLDLDMAILSLLQDHSGGILLRTNTKSMLDNLMDMAPLREGPTPDTRPTNPPKDWSSRAGFYPITLLRFLRWARRAMTRRSKWYNPAP